MSDQPVNGSVPHEVGGEGPFAKKQRMEAEIKAAAEAKAAEPVVEAAPEPEPEAPKKSQRASSRFG